MASKPSPVRATGLGPVKNSSLLGGLIPPKLTPVRASGGPRSPGSMPMPNWGPSFNQPARPLPKVKGGTGGQKFTKPGKQRLTPRSSKQVGKGG